MENGGTWNEGTGNWGTGNGGTENGGMVGRGRGGRKWETRGDGGGLPDSINHNFVVCTTSTFRYST
jgi:hypothetical protein